MKKQVVIRGAGITGLSLGFYLRERFGEQIDLHILEKSERPGGWIETLREGPFVFEKGPRTLRLTGKTNPTIELIQKIGLEMDLAFSKKESSIRYLLHQGKLEKVPATLKEMFTSPLLKGKKRDLLKGLLKWGSEKEDSSIYSFAKRRFSKEIAEEIFAPLALGIFAGDIKHLSLKHCFPSLYKWDQKKLPFILSLLWNSQSSKLFTLKTGLETLPLQLAKRLEKEIHYGVSEIPLKADHLFSTVPAYGKIPLQSVTIAHLGWEGKQLHFPGFGYLIPKKEHPNLMGVVFDSEIFPEESLTTRMTVMMRTPDLEETLFHVKKVLKIDKKPSFCQLSLAKDAIPQYPLGFDQILEELYAQNPKEVSFIGSSYTGISINECIAAAQKAAYSLKLST